MKASWNTSGSKAKQLIKIMIKAACFHGRFRSLEVFVTTDMREISGCVRPYQMGHSLPNEKSSRIRKRQLLQEKWKSAPGAKRMNLQHVSFSVIDWLSGWTQQLHKTSDTRKKNTVLSSFSILLMTIMLICVHIKSNIYFSCMTRKHLDSPKPQKS